MLHAAKRLRNTALYSIYPVYALPYYYLFYFFTLATIKLIIFAIHYFNTVNLCGIPQFQPQDAFC